MKKRTRWSAGQWAYVLILAGLTTALMLGAQLFAETKGNLFPSRTPLMTYWLPVCALFTLGAIGLSILLFILRGRQRSVYGLLEVLAGIATVIFYAAIHEAHTVYGGAGQLTFLGMPPWTYPIFQICIGVYVIIRGLDNIERSLASASCVARFWRVVFLQEPL